MPVAASAVNVARVAICRKGYTRPKMSLVERSASAPVGRAWLGHTFGSDASHPCLAQSAADVSEKHGCRTAVLLNHVARRVARFSSSMLASALHAFSHAQIIHRHANQRDNEYRDGCPAASRIGQRVNEHIQRGEYEQRRHDRISGNTIGWIVAGHLS